MSSVSVMLLRYDTKWLTKCWKRFSKEESLRSRKQLNHCWTILSSIFNPHSSVTDVKSMLSVVTLEWTNGIRLCILYCKIWYILKHFPDLMVPNYFISAVISKWYKRCVRKEQKFLILQNTFIINYYRAGGIIHG